MATIRDIAERAGVTATTVSRVLNNRGYISEETRRKVNEVMREMNYQPNEIARVLSKKHTNTIGVIVPHVTHPFFSKLISSLEEAASERGYKILLCNSKEQPEKETEYLNMFIANKVSGIVVCSKYIQKEKFKKLQIPIINFERDEEDEESVSIQCDNYQGGRLAAQHLIDKGCRSLLYFGGILENSTQVDKRAAGFGKVCKEAGVKSAEFRSPGLTYGFVDYEKYIEEGLEKNPGVDGIFASGDLIAAKIIQVCQKRYRKIPDQIKLVGFDDVMLTELTVPTITTIHQPVEEMSKMSVDYIIQSLKGKVIPSNTVMPVNLVQREST